MFEVVVAVFISDYHDGLVAQFASDGRAVDVAFLKTQANFSKLASQNVNFSLWLAEDVIGLQG